MTHPRHRLLWSDAEGITCANSVKNVPKTLSAFLKQMIVERPDHQMGTYKRRK
jgi:hypothetical protein